MTMPSRAQAVIGGAIRRYKAFSGVSIVQTRLIVSLGVLLLAQFTSVFSKSVQTIWIILSYIVLTVVLVLLSSTVLEQKRVRAIPDLLDLLVISYLVKSTGGLSSPWFLLYLFPVMSAARYLGSLWSITVAVFASLAYGYASDVLEPGNAPAVYSFWLRALVLGGAALTAANLAKTRDRAEAKLVRAIERIDREILSDTDLKRVMHSILNAAMNVTDSDLSAIALVEGDKITSTFAAAKKSLRGTSNERERDAAAADRLVQQHCRWVLDLRQPLSLPRRRSLAEATRVLGSPDRASHWPARLVPLEIDETPFGVLGVFSCRILHYYTPNDLRKLLSMASLVAIAQKNATLFRELASREWESKERLQMLYEIGEQLKAEQGLDQVFREVVKLVSNRLGSEEAALFVPDDRGTRIVKVAVSGPNEETTKRLAAIELFYHEKDQSLTRRVFESKTPSRENHVSTDEYYVKEYSDQLPSQRTRHYMGVPLLIGGEVLGVIRVLNKKAKDYSSRIGSANLAEEGFEEEDLDLLKLIATQIASAIRNAKFIDKTRYFENLVYNSPDPIIVLDKAGYIQNFNKECEKIWGLSEREVFGKSVASYYESAEHAKEIGRALWKAKGHTIQDFNARIRHVKGDVIPIRLSATLLLDKDGQEAGSIGVFKDEREMLRLEEEKIRAEKLAALGRLAQTTGHDIKHDLGAVLNYLSSLEHNASADPRMLSVYSAMRAAIIKALSKLQNLLMAAKPKPPEKRIISLKSILVEFEASNAHQASVTHVTFSPKYPECDPLVNADVDQMRQVFANLFGNSLDAIKVARARDRRSAGRIELTLEVADDVVLLSWCDDGCGISEKAKASAFTPFFTTKDTGSGLGLFITRTIVENHGGHVALESVEEGGGACFRITLPLFRVLASPQSIPS